MALLLRTRAVTANFANVPPQGFAKALANAEAVFAQRPGIGSITEAWHKDTRRGVFEAAPEQYRFVKLPRQSALLFWDAEEWTVVDTGNALAHPAVSIGSGRAFERISDTRRMPSAVLRHRRTGRRINIFGVHLAPIRPRLGREAVRRSEAAHDTARRNCEELIGSTAHAAVAMGDFNDHGKFLGNHGIPGRSARYAALGSIDQVIAVDGAKTRLVPGKPAFFRIPHGDHPHGDLKRSALRVNLSLHLD